MECGRVSVASLSAGHAQDLDELEAIRENLAATQERLARLAAAMTARHEMMMALVPAPTLALSSDEAHAAPVKAIVEVEMDEAPASLALGMMARADQTPSSSTPAATAVPTGTDDESHPTVAVEASAETSNWVTTATTGGDEPPLSAMESHAPATLSSDQPRTDTENAGAVDVASDEPCEKAVEVVPAVPTEELSIEPANDADLPLVSAAPAEPLRAVRLPEALPDTGAGSAAPAFEPEILQLLVWAETAPDDASTAKTATVIVDDTAVETTVPAPNGGPAALSDNATSASSLTEMEDGNLPMPQIAPAVAEGAAQEPRVPEALARSDAFPSPNPQSAAAREAAIVASGTVTPEAAATPVPAAEHNVVSLDAARAELMELARLRPRRRAVRVALLATAASIATIVATAHVHVEDLAPYLPIDRLAEILSAAMTL